MKTLIESIIGRRGATKRDKSDLSTGDIFWIENMDIFGVVWLPGELNSFVNKFSQVLTNSYHSIPTTDYYPEGIVVFGFSLTEVSILDLSKFDNNFYYHGGNGIKSIQHDNIRNIIRSGVTKIFER